MSTIDVSMTWPTLQSEARAIIIVREIKSIDQVDVKAYTSGKCYKLVTLVT